MTARCRLFRALAAADSQGVIASPAAVLVELPAPLGGTDLQSVSSGGTDSQSVSSGGTDLQSVSSGGTDLQSVSSSPTSRLPTLLASGRAADVAVHEAAANAAVIDLPTSILLPALVNAHTHLDLTHIGPQPFDPDEGFAGWARMIIRERLADPAELTASVNEGIRLSRAGGVVALGDIAGVLRTEPIHALRDSGLLGTSFIEFFGLGQRQEQAISSVQSLLRTLGMSESSSESRGTRVGLQPHAPYTAGLRAFDWASRQQLPLCTHLAETTSEHDFITHASGSFRAFLESMGLWDDSILTEVGKGLHPIAHLAPALRAAPGRWLVAHVNDCDDPGLQILAETNTSVAYCPRSSSYFRNHESFGPHRYRDMLRAGINVCLGTDSIVNLPPDESDRLSTLDEMRFLFRRDATDPLTLLQMATTNGAHALRLEPALFLLRGRHPIAGLIALDLAHTDPSLPILERAMLPSPLPGGGPLLNPLL